MQFQVTFHIEEDSLKDAEDWLARAKTILEHSKSLLVSASTNRGSWCPGHVYTSDVQESNASNPPNVLQMGPRG
jgi:hypothetical protein